MNYLAHIFLSGSDPKMQLGNFFADAVKGNSYKDYPQEIIEGILRHRAIDLFTDTHPAIRDTIRSLRPYFGRYSGILLDIYFDYLLASHFHEYSEVPLKKFARKFYFTMIRNRKYLPDRFKRFMWHFILTDRLSKYATSDGIKDSLQIMVRAQRIKVSVHVAIQYLEEHEEELFAVFQPFLGELLGYCNESKYKNNTQ